MDTRYEVRDAQELAGLLADEGRTSFTQIGAIGGSYGGGMSMALAALKDRKMLPDGSLTAWQSPNGTPMQIAAAAPEIPWTDLPYSLVPERPHARLRRRRALPGPHRGAEESWENALYNSGLAVGFYAAAGADPDADLRNWHITFNTGEPYDDASGNPLPAFADIRDELTTHHSSYYIDHSQAPAPLLISSGWTDDLFPADEAIRFYNRTRTQYPGADISLFFGSFGHQRGQNKADATCGARGAQELAWFDYYVQGHRQRAVPGRHRPTPQTCPNAAAVGRPVHGRRLGAARAGRGAVRRGRAADDPADGGLDRRSRRRSTRSPGPAHAPPRSATDQADTATYRIGPGAGGRLHADGLADGGGRHHVAGLRLPDRGAAARRRPGHEHADAGRPRPVAPGDQRRRPERQVFQLHPNGYRFAAGHVVKLELLPKDSNTAAGNSYGRTSNGQQNVTVENLQLRLPVLEAPGSLGGLVEDPAAKVVPPGYELARRLPGPALRAAQGGDAADVSLVPAYEACTAPDRTHGPPLAFGVLQPADARRPTTSPSGRRTPTASRRVRGHVRVQA